jgi:hypothetical protein
MPYISGANNYNNSSATSIDTNAFGVFTGGLIVVTVRNQGSNTVTVNDNSSNTYTELTAIEHNGDRLQQFYALNVTGSGSMVVTATFTLATSYIAITADHYTDIDSFDLEASGTGSGSFLETGTFSPSSPDALVYLSAQVADLSNASYIAGTGYTMRQNAPGNGIMGTADQFLSSTQIGMTGSMTASVSVSWTILASVFNLDTGGGAPATDTGGLTTRGVG